MHSLKAIFNIGGITITVVSKVKYVIYKIYNIKSSYILNKCCYYWTNFTFEIDFVKQTLDTHGHGPIIIQLNHSTRKPISTMSELFPL